MLYGTMVDLEFLGRIWSLVWKLFQVIMFCGVFGLSIFWSSLIGISFLFVYIGIAKIMAYFKIREKVDKQVCNKSHAFPIMIKDLELIKNELGINAKEGNETINKETTKGSN